VGNRALDLLMSLYRVEYHVIGRQKNRDGSLYESCRTAISQLLSSKPRLRMI
jgi:hypothetical protein